MVHDIHSFLLGVIIGQPILPAMIGMIGSSMGSFVVIYARRDGLSRGCVVVKVSGVVIVEILCVIDLDGPGGADDLHHGAG
jgi:hypothetical protein